MIWAPDKYLTSPVANNDLVQAIEAGYNVPHGQATREFSRGFSLSRTTGKAGLTPRGSRGMLWLSQARQPRTRDDFGITEST